MNEPSVPVDVPATEFQAVKLWDFNGFWVGHTSLYRCTPGGVLPEYVVAAEDDVDDTVDVFRSDVDGIIYTWSKLLGSGVGTQKDALSRAGYEVHK